MAKGEKKTLLAAIVGAIAGAGAVLLSKKGNREALAEKIEKGKQLAEKAKNKAEKVKGQVEKELEKQTTKTSTKKESTS